MSTIKSDNSDLTINASGSTSDIKFQANGVEKASISSAGAFTSTSIDATKLTGDLPVISGASLTSLTSGNLTGALPAISGASLTNLPAGGITEADQWRLTSNVTLGNDLVSQLNANWERVDTDGFGKLGTGMTESSGVFSFPSTGVWLVTFNVNGHVFNTSSRYYNADIYTTTNNSTYSQAALAQTSGYNSGGGTYISASATFMFDVTDVSTHKLRTQVVSIGGGFVQSNTSATRTGLTFIKLGDT